MNLAFFVDLVKLVRSNASGAGLREDHCFGSETAALAGRGEESYFPKETLYAVNLIIFKNINTSLSFKKVLLFFLKRTLYIVSYSAL